MQPQRWQPSRLPRPWDSLGKDTRVGCHFLLQCMKVKSESEVAQSCPTLHDPMDCSLPGSSIHGIFQARILEWGAIAFSNQEAWVAEIEQIRGRVVRDERRKVIEGPEARSGWSLWAMLMILTFTQNEVGSCGRVLTCDFICL